MNGTVAENQQLVEIESLGLIDDIEHHRNWMKKKNKKGEMTKHPRGDPLGSNPGRFVTGKTIVALYKKEDWNLRKERPPTMVARAIAYCSTSDTFCRRTGRILARGRALREARKVVKSNETR